MKYFSLLIFLFFGIFSQAIAVPKKVIIIRHGEKKPNEDHLNLKGFERAGALPHYFSGIALYNTPHISHIFATAPKENSRVFT